MTNDYMFHIYTLGKFEIYSKGVKITENNKRSAHVWNLFKYILAHRKKMLSSDELIGAVWGEEDCENLENPEKALQNLIYRLRTALSLAVEAEDLILFNQDCYQWNEKFPVWIDSDALIEYGKKGGGLIESLPYEAIQYFEKVMELYNGEFLNDTDDIWVIPMRATYKNAYSESVMSFLGILDRFGDFESVIKVCNNFFKYELFEERGHYYFLKAFVRLDRKQDALKYYDIMAKAIQREFGVAPSYTFEDILKYTKEHPMHKETKNIDLNYICDILRKDSIHSGAFQCDKESFAAISRIMLRNLTRSELSIMMVLVTFSRIPDGNTNIIKNARGKLMHALREGDVVCHWNAAQTLIMLASRPAEDADTAMRRITEKLHADILREHYDISYKILPLTHEIDG